MPKKVQAKKTASKVRRPVVVPTRDASTGERLPSRRVARWHLLRAEARLRRAWLEEQDPVMLKAAATLSTIYRALADDGDRKPILEFASADERRTDTTRAKMVDHLAHSLPHTVADAQRRGFRDVAMTALCVACSSPTKDGAKILRMLGSNRIDALPVDRLWAEAEAMGRSLARKFDDNPDRVDREGAHRYVIRQLFERYQLGTPWEAERKRRQRANGKKRDT